MEPRLGAQELFANLIIFRYWKK